MGGSGPKTHWGMRLLDKIMILQGVKLTIQPLGVGYANRPKKAKMGGYVAFSPYIDLPGFDLTTLCEVISEILQVSLNSLHNANFGAFWRAMARAIWAWRPLRGSPVGAQVPVLSLNHHPSPSQGRQKGFRKSPISEILQVSLNRPYPA